MARSRMVARSRVVVVFPFVPITSAMGEWRDPSVARIPGSIRSAMKPGSAVAWWPVARLAYEVPRATAIATALRTRPPTGAPNRSGSCIRMV